MSAVGTYVFDKTSLDAEANVALGLDYQRCRQIVAGATATACSARVLLDNAASSHFTLGTPSIAAGGKSASVRVTDAGATVGASYRLVFDATLSDSTVLVRWITLNVQGP